MPLPRPPSADPLVALADQCVQCGLCLPACPTYRQGRIEAESPRGRIALARGWALEALEPGPVGDAHLDACLGCRSCEAVCPAGVRYGALLHEARARQRRRRPAGLRQRTIEALAARPGLLRRLLATYRRAFPLLPARLRPLPRPPAPVRTVPTGPASTRPRAALFVGCVADAYEPPTRRALHRLFDAIGIDLVEPAGQGCCGSLHRHAGDASTADRLQHANAAAFDGQACVVTLASGCHEAVVASAPGVEDALVVLARHVDALRFRGFEGRVALHLPCTQRNVARSVPALRRLLAQVPGLDIVDLDAGDGCCGAAGSTMLVDPDRAATFRAPLVAQVEARAPALVLSANLGCRLHLRNGLRIEVVHPVEFLAAQLDDASPPRR
ncbi:(Fe-S)-binding protein [Lysobacter xanthus]